MKAIVSRKIGIAPLPIENRQIPCQCVFCQKTYTEGDWHHDPGALNVCFECAFPVNRHGLRGFGMPLSKYWLWEDTETFIVGTPTRLFHLALRHLELAIIHLEIQCKA